MVRSPWQRAVAGFLGVWFTTTVTGLTLPACPEHGGGMLSIAQGAHQNAHQNAHQRAHQGMPPGAAHELAGPGMPLNVGQVPAAESVGKSGPSGGHHDEAGHHCTCPGTCCATSAITLVPGRLVTIPIVQMVAAVVSTVETLDGAPRAPPDVVLPLPLGPPTLRV